jgi:hypothetical protein
MGRDRLAPRELQGRARVSVRRTSTCRVVWQVIRRNGSALAFPPVDASSMLRVLRIGPPVPLGMTPIFVSRTPHQVATGTRRTTRGAPHGGAGVAAAETPLNVVGVLAGPAPDEPRTSTFQVGQ